MSSEDNNQSLNESVEEAIQHAKKYLEDLLSFFGLNTDVYATTEDNEVIELHVPSTHLNGFLIGQRGDTMRAIQSLVSNALRSSNFATYRVNVDIAEYKKQRAQRLADKAQKWLDEVKDSGQEKHLDPMNAADRRTIHKLADDEGLVTESVGEGRDRHIVLKPGEASAVTEEAPEPKESKETEEPEATEKSETTEKTKDTKDKKPKKATNDDK